MDLSRKGKIQLDVTCPPSGALTFRARSTRFGMSGELGTSAAQGGHLDAILMTVIATTVLTKENTRPGGRQSPA